MSYWRDEVSVFNQRGCIHTICLFSYFSYFSLHFLECRLVSMVNAQRQLSSSARTVSLVSSFVPTAARNSMSLTTCFIVSFAWTPTVSLKDHSHGMSPVLSPSHLSKVCWPSSVPNLNKSRHGFGTSFTRTMPMDKLSSAFLSRADATSASLCCCVIFGSSTSRTAALLSPQNRWIFFAR